MENLHWGEEIEYHLYSLDKDKHTVKLCCDAQQILKSLNSEQQKTNGFKLMPEFGEWMLEAVPSEPYNTYQDPD
jgi:hypothetical protein